MKLDSAVSKLLSLEAATVVVSSAGRGDSAATASKVKATLPDGSTKTFFLKTGRGPAAEVMFREVTLTSDKGEHASLTAIHDAVPKSCPASFGHGRMNDSPSQYFLATEHLDISGRGSASAGQSLAAKLAKLHTTPAPIPDGHDKPMFGFPEVTCCGDTAQPNDFMSSWADFYAEHRLRFILKQSEKSNGADEELRKLVLTTADKVVPRLIGDKHLNNGKGVTPVVVHGDLWSGNASTAKIGEHGEVEEVVYDSSACYAHNEYELGIMKMFGGFGGAFLKEYHSLCSKTDPVDEYDDRVALYELYHHLNHHAMFGGGYRSGATAIMKSLIHKYAR